MAGGYKIAYGQTSGGAQIPIKVDSTGRVVVITRNKGWFATQAALVAAWPTGSAGDFAIVGATNTVWVWDVGGAAWLDTAQSGLVLSVNGQTGAVILDLDDIGDGSTYGRVKLSELSTGQVKQIRAVTGTADVSGDTIKNHIDSTLNPHSVTATQVGLGNVTNDAQIKKLGSSTDNAILRWDGANGDTVQGVASSKNILIDDSGHLLAQTHASQNIGATATRFLNEFINHQAVGVYDAGAGASDPNDDANAVSYVIQRTNAVGNMALRFCYQGQYGIYCTAGTGILNATNSTKSGFYDASVCQGTPSLSLILASFRSALYEDMANGGSYSTIAGAYMDIHVRGTATHTVTSALGGYFRFFTNNSGGSNATITTAKGVHGEVAKGTTNTINTGYGGYFLSTACTANYGIYAEGATAAVRAKGHVIPDADSSYDLGVTGTGRWQNVFANAIKADTGIGIGAVVTLTRMINIDNSGYTNRVNGIYHNAVSATTTTYCAAYFSFNLYPASPGAFNSQGVDVAINLSNAAITSGTLHGVRSIVQRSGSAVLTTAYAGYFKATDATTNYAIAAVAAAGQYGLMITSPNIQASTRSNGPWDTHEVFTTGLKSWNYRARAAASGATYYYDFGESSGYSIVTLYKDDAGVASAVIITNAVDSPTASTGQELLDVRGGNVKVDSANAYYFGESDADGSWRIVRSGNDLVIQRRESAAWVTKDTIAA